MSKNIVILQGDCLEIIDLIISSSVDMVLSDLPYGITNNSWDCRINLSELWPKLYRVCKRDAALVFTAAPPFDKILAASNIKDYKYDWVWEKGNATGHLNAYRMPLKSHENVCVFYRSPPAYFPQKTTGHRPVNSFYTRRSGSNYSAAEEDQIGGGSTERFPRTVIRMSSDKQTRKGHSTQKPIELMRYFIRTYTRPGDTVLDCCMGSGSTGLACIAEDRKFIGIELDKSIYSSAKISIDTHANVKGLL